MRRAEAAVLFLAFSVAACKPPNANDPGANGGAGLNLPLAPKQLSLELASRGASVAFDALVNDLSTELERSQRGLATLNPAPYFVAYQVADQSNVRIEASDGALLTNARATNRSLDVDLRIGSQAKDNTHRIPGESSGSLKAAYALPLAGGREALSNVVWLATDQEYDIAKARWLRVEAQTDEEEPKDNLPRADFSIEEAVVYAQPRLETTLDEALWTDRIREVSRAAADYSEIQRSSAALSVVTETRYLVNTEGTKLQLSRRSVRVELQVQTIASDGMVLERFDSIDTHDLEALPNTAAITQRFRSLFEDIRALREAKVIEPYVGPAILDGRAAGVFFHEVFGHRIEGHRQDAENEGQTFANMVGQQIMLPSLTIYDDPSALRLNGVDLNGFYLFDDEGVAAQRAKLVEGGVLNGFLLSRTPARGFLRSNGHGRREPGFAVVARQANLVVDPAETVTPATLKSVLLSEVERQKLPYGLRFSEISGGFTQTQRYDTQAFKVIPVMVYKVYPDGREELVRGVDIEGTPLTALSKILVAANDFQVFNGLCGAESGWVPVSATSPSLLLSQVEVARQEQSDEEAPLLPAPSAGVSPTPRRAR
jgi:TldD protein